MPIWFDLALGWLKNIPLYIWIIGLLVCSNLFTYTGWHLADSALKHERSVHMQDNLAFESGQMAADIRAQAIKDQLIKEAKANATQADANYANLLAQYHASLLRYQAHQGATKPADNHRLPTPQGGDRPGESTQLPETVNITITNEDAEVCAVNTARLQAVHDWAVTLPK